VSVFDPHVIFAAMRRGLLILCVFIAACRGGEHRIGGNAKPPVIIISIDTLRSDHLPMYGYTRVATPSLDALRKDSILFERAYSHTPLTLPSHASILTGALPADHGIRDNMGYKLSAVTSLPEALKKRGYATGAAVSAIVLRSETGINRGFDFWDDNIDVDTRFLSMGRVQRAGDATREVAQKWIGEHKSQPFFFMFHIYEPHMPYEPLEPFATTYGRTYDADIASADAVVGRFIDFLKQQGIYDEALIILLSDHGEGLGDHGEDEHGILLYREAIQVPLLVKLPSSSSKGTSVSSVVQLTDIYPTIAEATGAERGPKVHGASLLSDAIRTTRSVYSETYFPRFHYGWNDLHSIVNGDHHYIQSQHPELFDVVKDPSEKVNTLDENRRTYVALKTEIAGYIQKASAPANVDPEQAKKLAALGYIGSSAAGADEVLPDPREHIQSASRMKEGYRLFQDGEYHKALAILDELLRENPRMLDIWSMKARSLAKLGRAQEAVVAAQQALKLQPQSANMALIVANLALEAGDLDTAKRHAELAVNDEPGQAHYLLAEVAIERKELAVAKREADLTLQTKRDGPLALMMLGRIAKEEGNFAEALTRLDAALKVVKEQNHSAVPRLQYLRGDTLARLGRQEEAEAAFREEIREFPTEPAPYKNLILLYVLQGKTDEATQLIFALEQKSPTPPSYVAIAEALKTIGDANGARFWAAKGLQRYPNDAHLKSLLRG
jgi:arylsulfatase A-like enzyme/Tfp pilus assembly protein PilF